MLSRFLKVFTILILVLGLNITLVGQADAATKVMWGKTELKLGQIGKATILADTTLVKLGSDGSISTVRAMKKGEEYRVYNYKGNHGGLFGVGGGNYIQKNAKVKYETPSKSKLALLNKSEVLVVDTKPTNPKPLSIADSIQAEMTRIEGLNAKNISLKDYFLEIESLAKKYDDNKSKLNKNEQLIISAKMIGLFAKGNLNMKAVVFSYTDGVKVGSTNIQDAHSIHMFENNIYLNERRIEDLVNALDRTIEFRGNTLPGGLEEVFNMGAYFNRDTKYYNMNDLLSKQYTSHSITNKSNNKLEYSNKDFPYSAVLYSGFVRNPYSIEEVKNILGVDFSYNYDSSTGVLTFNIPFDSPKK